MTPDARRPGLTPGRIAAWSGPATVAIAFAGWLIAGVLPLPLGPSSSSEKVVAFYSHDTRVIAGLIIACLGISLALPFIAAVSIAVIRAERGLTIVSVIQLLAGAVTAVLLLIPMLLMTYVAFRPDRDPAITVTLNDLAWLLFLTPIGPFIIQDLAIAAAILRDPEKTLPRWLGYLNLWVALCFLPDPLAFVFHHGPFAWNGIIIFWLALTAYSVWLIAMGVVLARKPFERADAESR